MRWTRIGRCSIESISTTMRESALRIIGDGRDRARHDTSRALVELHRQRSHWIYPTCLRRNWAGVGYDRVDAIAGRAHRGVYRCGAWRDSPTAKPWPRRLAFSRLAGLASRARIAIDVFRSHVDTERLALYGSRPPVFYGEARGSRRSEARRRAVREKAPAQSAA